MQGSESVPGNLVADRLDTAGYSLGLQMDSDGSVELTTAGTAFGNTTALTDHLHYRKHTPQRPPSSHQPATDTKSVIEYGNIRICLLSI